MGLPASTVINRSAGLKLPSISRRFKRPSALPVTNLNLIPVSFLKLFSKGRIKASFRAEYIFTTESDAYIEKNYLRKEGSRPLFVQNIYLQPSQMHILKKTINENGQNYQKRYLSHV